ncbi:small nuclear ribonucleoprotein G-like [Marmota flaviventris]|uniref:small nuclear ribonucleoprotein G-like n=1 Tax=Marmota flaviventris TaxID=93162 RepID=UPI000FFFB56F|nr:small nuclear ribonucleoprotein G-like [Marmota flaviventris]
MSYAYPPKLKKNYGKKIKKKLNGGRHVQEILLGFDPFMNLVIDALWKWQSVEQNNIEMMATQGNSIVVLEGLEQV